MKGRPTSSPFVDIQFTEVNELDSSTPSSPPSTGVFGNTPYNTTSNSAPNDNIPCPRTSGAVFSASGIKLLFLNSHSLYSRKAVLFQ
jgi:hypothetical protein